jgi:Leucine-rich repeat (LRR) protein
VKLIKTIVIISMMINAACQTQDSKMQPVDLELVPRIVNMYPALKHPEQVYYLELENCPKELEKLPRLQYLFFGPCNVDSTMMDEVKKALYITELGLWDCKIEKLSFSDIQKKNLKLLNLAHSVFSETESTFQEIAELSEVEKLSISLTNIPYFPESWTGLKNLKTVDVGNKKEICDLERSFNNLAKLPALETLYINVSDIAVLPGSFQQLKAIKGICFNACKNLELVHIVNQVKDWKNLEYLGICAIEDETLPEELTKLSSLKKIDLVEMQKLDIRQALSVVSQIEGLEELDLSYSISGTEEENKGLIDDLAKLKNLKKLYIAEARVIGDESFWGVVSQLESLEELVMSDTPSYLTDDVFKLKKLKKLNISWTDIEEIANVDKFPPSLEELKFKTSNLKEFPKQIINSPGLKSVNLFSNDIKTIPEEIGDMKQLFLLDLGYNKIEELPESISKLKGSLKYLNLMGNPIGTNAEKLEQIRKWLPNTEIFQGS